MFAIYSSKRTSPGTPCQHCKGSGRVDQTVLENFKWRVDCDRCGRNGPRLGLAASAEAAANAVRVSADTVPVGWRREISRDGIEPERHICEECIAAESRDRIIAGGG